jgi:hypothetical protein
MKPLAKAEDDTMITSTPRGTHVADFGRDNSFDDLGPNMNPKADINDSMTIKMSGSDDNLSHSIDGAKANQGTGGN